MKTIRVFESFAKVNSEVVEQEIWKDIPGYEGVCQVSNTGRVKGLPRKANNHTGCIKLGERTLLRTGISIELPQGYGALVMGRSGNTIKRGLFVALGLIDSDYRGEIGVMAFNATDKKDDNTTRRPHRPIGNHTRTANTIKGNF